MANENLKKLKSTSLSLFKDLRIRFAIAMIGNLFILWFLASYFKNIIPNLPEELI